MKTLGIVGGIGPESTLDYYRSLIQKWREQTKDGSAPSIVVNSIDLKRVLDLIAANELSELTAYLSGEMERLVRAGADVGLFASNTPHIVFDDVQRRSPIPLISIVEATCAEAKKQGIGKAGLLGTRFTMQATFYPQVFSREGIRVMVPEQDEQDYIHGKYVGELLKDMFLPETREKLLAIIRRMKEQREIQGIILGGTELPLLLRDEAAFGIPLLDTTRIHVQAVVAELLS